MASKPPAALPQKHPLQAGGQSGDASQQPTRPHSFNEYTLRASTILNNRKGSPMCLETFGLSSG